MPDLIVYFGPVELAALALGLIGATAGLVAWQRSRAHGGDLTVQSELGKGSTFTLVLPVE